MLDVVSQQPTGGPMAQVRRLDPKVGSRLALFCIYHVNQANSRDDLALVIFFFKFKYHIITIHFNFYIPLVVKIPRVKYYMLKILLLLLLVVVVLLLL